MSPYGSWKETIYIDGEPFKADLAEQSYAARAGFSKIYAINGLPPHFEKKLVTASQVTDVPHTWRVKECKSESEVTGEILQRGIEALRKDRRELNAHVITYAGDPSGDGSAYEFLAAGAIRDKLTRDYQDAQYPVISRAIVAPKYRGKGLGSLIVEHRMKAVLNSYFGQKPKAIHFATESKKILQSVKKVERDEGLKFVYIGDESYTASDGTHIVHDFLCFVPWFQEELLSVCDTLKSSAESPQMITEFKEKLTLFMQSGVESVSGTEVETRFQKISGMLAQKTGVQNALQVIGEIFKVKEKIGAKDPESLSNHSKE